MLPANLWVDVQSRIDGDADPRLRVAGMNPFTLIQLFVGGPEEADGGPIQWLAPVDSTSMLDQSDASLAIANSQRWSLSAVTVLVAASYLYQRRIHRTNRETGESRFVLSR